MGKAAVGAKIGDGFGAPSPMPVAVVLVVGVVAIVGTGVAGLLAVAGAWTGAVIIVGTVGRSLQQALIWVLVLVRLS